jgi:hypothetical protein
VGAAVVAQQVVHRVPAHCRRGDQVGLAQRLEELLGFVEGGLRQVREGVQREKRALVDSEAVEHPLRGRPRRSVLESLVGLLERRADAGIAQAQVVQPVAGTGQRLGEVRQRP